jgi:hypothetical protein
MRIIGCDLHARQQTIARLDTTTGEVSTLTLIRIATNRLGERNRLDHLGVKLDDSKDRGEHWEGTLFHHLVQHATVFIQGLIAWLVK